MAAKRASKIGNRGSKAQSLLTQKADSTGAGVLKPRRLTIRINPPAVKLLNAAKAKAAAAPKAAVKHKAVRKVKSRKATAGHQGVLPNPFRFLALPAEVRNIVYEYALTSPDDVEISKGEEDVPGLIHVNHQIRKETRTIFLANSFTFVCKDADMNPLWRFMHALGLNKEDTAGLELFGVLTIFCHGRIFPSYSPSMPFKHPENTDWEHWMRILMQLKATGLTVQQLKWLPWLPVRQQGGRTLGWDDFRPGEAGAMKYIFFEYFLERLMVELHYYSGGRTPALSVQVLQQVMDEWERLGLEEDASGEMWHHLRTYCSDREAIPLVRQRYLISERTRIVRRIVDICWKQLVPLACEPLLALLRKLVDFDLRYGETIHRDAKQALQLHDLVKSAAEQKGERLGANALFTSEHSKMISEYRGLAEIPDVETEEETRTRLEAEAELDRLNADGELAWRVEEYVEQVNWGF